MSRDDRSERAREREMETEELTMAAVDLAFAVRDDAALPAELAERVAAGADRHFASLAGSRGLGPERGRHRAETTTGAAGAQVIVMPIAPPESHAAWKSFDVVRWSGWLAAVACVALLALHSLRPASPGALRGADTVRVTIDGSDATGEVTWSATAQSGTMRVRGLTANDPAVSRYEVWMRDAARDLGHPVPVGLFDATAGGESLVTFAPPVRVTSPVELFVTREAPAGEVVRAEGPVVATASFSAALPR